MAWAYAIGKVHHGANGTGNPAPQRENAHRICAAIAAIGRKAFAIMADVSSEEGADKLVEEAASALGRIDILVNNAGIAHTAPIEDIPVETWDRMLAVHLRSQFLMTRLVLPTHRYSTMSLTT